MKIIDVRSSTTNIYSISKQRVQKATSHLWWSDLIHQLATSQESNLLLLDESYFKRYHMTIRLHQTTALTWTIYKELMQEKVTEVQTELGVKAEQLTYVVKNRTIDKTPVDHVIGETGLITFDICFFALDTQWSDIAHLKHVRRYPRRYFLLNHPLLAKKESIALLAISGSESSLIELEHGWYKKISSLNGGDDLLRQAYEQAWLDPLISKHKEFDEHSIWEKLLFQAHQEFTSILLGRVQSHLPAQTDTMLLSRLLEQKYFVETLSEVYIKELQGRLIPYRGVEKEEFYGRYRQIDELPVVLLLQYIQKEKE